ncbi:hypothetical protein [Marinobacter sp.]|uniref:hypothetical protein n=1 Tax=Marinobacter sp. TaxID=50741 RepID=UPI0035639B21
MIISHKYKFIFIKTVKTAGTSIEVFLSKICDENDVVTPVEPEEKGHMPRNYKGVWNPMREITSQDHRGYKRTIKEFLSQRRFYNHIPARVLRHRVPHEIWNGYYKFCVERNPWDKSISHFNMVRKRKDEAMTFSDYLSNEKLCHNWPLYTDLDDKILVDRIVPFESLNEGLGEVFEKLSVPYSGKLKETAKSNYRTDVAPYQEFFNYDQRLIIEKAFEKEISHNGYDFLGG